MTLLANSGAQATNTHTVSGVLVGSGIDQGPQTVGATIGSGHHHRRPCRALCKRHGVTQSTSENSKHNTRVAQFRNASPAEQAQVTKSTTGVSKTCIHALAQYHSSPLFHHRYPFSTISIIHVLLILFLIIHYRIMLPMHLLHTMQQLTETRVIVTNPNIENPTNATLIPQTKRVHLEH
jgi:hypothetical protein